MATAIPDLVHEHETFAAEGLTYAEFQHQFEGRRAEWLDGKVILLVNNWQHQQILGFLYSLLNFYLSMKPIGKLTIAGFQMYLDLGDKQRGREPDLMIILNEHLDRIENAQLNGAADIAIEIVSPESRARDHVEKYEEYEAGGVTEYWIIDPLRQQADIYHLDDTGRYRRLNLDDQGRLISPLLPAFALAPDLLWQETLPNGMALWEIVQQMT